MNWQFATSRRFVQRLSLAVSLVLALTGYVTAQTEWIGAGSGDWSNAGNWNGTIPNTPGAIALFGPDAPSAPATIRIDQPVTLGELQVASPHLLLFSGDQPLTFSDPADATRAGTVVLAENSRILVAAPVMWAKPETLLLSVNVGSDLTFDALLGADHGSMEIAGDGLVFLGRENPAWDGRLQVSGATLELTSPRALGSNTGNTTIDSGGTLMLRGNFEIDRELITLDQGTIVAEPTANGNVTISSPVTLQGMGHFSTTQTGRTLQITGPISGPGGVTTRGQAILSGVNTYQGDTLVASGRLEATNPSALGSTGTVSIAESATLTVDANLVVPRMILHGGTLQGPEVSSRRLNAAIELTADSQLRRNLTIAGPVSGSAGWTLRDNVTLSGENTYAGLTTINQGRTTVTAPLSLGTLDAGTVIEPAGQLIVQAPIQENLLLSGGRVVFREPANTFGGELTSRGGTITIDQPGFAIANLNLESSTTDLVASSLGDVTIRGAGDLVYRGASLGNASLEHSGNLTIHPEGDFVLGRPLHFGGTLSIIGRRLTIQNADSLGLGNTPVQLVNTDVVLEANVVRDFSLRDSRLEVGDSGAVTGQLTFNGSSELVANAPLASSLQLDGFQTILRVGEVNGVIRGGGKLSFFRDQQPDPTVLNADNEYTGLTEINRGVVIVNAPRALGSPQVGTIVNSGQLQLNTTVDEPMTVTGSGHVRILASQPRLPVFAGYAERNSRGADSKISLEVDGEFDGTTVINQGELEVAASVQLESLVLRDFGRLSVRPEDSLTLDHEFEIRSGELNIEGAIRAPLGALRKTTASNATLFSLGDYDGDILIDQGVVIVQGSNGLGTSNGATIVASPATLILGGGITLAENIQLMNSVGFGYDGGLHYSGNANILTGPLELGDHGSRIVGGSGAWMHVEGPIHGGDLVSDASEDFSVLVLKSNANTYNGSTILRGGTVAIGGEGQLTTTTEIVVSNGATLALQNWEQNRPDRIADHIPIVMQGGLIRMDGGSREEFSETMGELRVAQGAARIEIAGDQDATNRFTFARLTREPGTTIEFEVLTDEFASGRDHTVHFQTAPALTNGILGGWAVVGDRGHPQLIGFATYDANGVGLMAATSTNLLSATATDHVRVRTNTTLAGNKTIASLLVFDLNSHVDLNLGGHLLTVESGGVIAPSARILEGQITAGSQSGQELIVQGGGEFLATVVDNQSGPVNLTFVGRGALLGTNEHTGLTQLLGNSSVLSHVDLSPMAIPAGGDLVLDRVQVREVGEASRAWELGRLEVRGRSNVSFSRPVSFEQFDLIEGEVSGPLVGTGVLRKSGLTEASLYANLREFNGQVIVEEGRLITFSDVLNSASVVGGILRLRATHGRQNVDLTLGGGTVELGGSDLGGTMDIMAPTTIHLIEGDVLLRSELTGSSPLRISGNGRGRMEVAFRSDQPPTFSGPFSVENATLSMPAGAWGTGKIQVLKEGAYHPSLIQFDPAEPSSLQNDVELHDGIMIVSSGQVPGGGIDGELTVKGISLLGLRDSADILAVRGPVRLEDSATLQLNGFGNISFEGPILVGANASIDARVRDYHSFRPAGQVQFAGPITANAPNASLDLIAVGVAVNTSLNIPAGQSLQVRLNGQPVAVTLDQPTEFMEGNGSLDNDVILSHGGRITPGSSVGTLTVLGNAEFSDGGVYAWELSDAAAASNGWDQVHIDGTLSVSARSDAPFLIQLAGLDPQGNAGAPLNFDSAKSATWLIAAAEQIDGWTDHNIVVDAASLESHVSVAADRRWYVSPRHGGLHLTYLVPSEIDSIQDADERELFVREMLRTWFGDANLDGQFSSSDLVQVFTLGQYEDSVAGNSTWRSGDWNGDGDFGSSDLVVAFQDGGYEQGNRLAVAASVAPASASLGAKPIPEPTSLSPLAWLITSLLVRRLKKHP